MPLELLHETRLISDPTAYYIEFDNDFDNVSVKEKKEADRLWDAEFDALEEIRLEEQHYICSKCFEITELGELIENAEIKPTCSCGCQEFMPLQ